MPLSAPGTYTAIYPGDPDADAVTAARRGNKPAFTELVRRLETRVFRFISRQIHTPQDAEDLTQETFLEAHRRFAHFRGESRFSTWVLGIARNMVRNHINRSPGYRYNQIPTDEMAEIADSEKGPEEQAQAAARLQALKEGLGKLTPDLREALTLVSLEGMNYDEAAQVIGIPMGTLKTRIFRARSALRKALKQSGQMDLFKG
ncbi:MAG: sigma-70 family RNA polymerase sigma factor [Magnetococcales bacterium]|nr:sigma-70 family RNA polymerase sigma factor [Magnetococcales bacterium]